MDKRTAVIRMLIFLHVICGCMILAYYIGLCYKFERPWLHGLLGLIAMLLLACAISIFPIWHGHDTDKLKYVHIITHIFVLVCLIGTLVTERSALSIDLIKTNSYSHEIPSLLAFAFYLFQFIVSFIILLIIKSKQVRSFFLPLHRIIGIWFYMCMVGTAITGMHDCTRFLPKLIKHDEMAQCLTHLHALKSLIIANTFLLHVTVFWPYFATTTTITGGNDIIQSGKQTKDEAKEETKRKLEQQEKRKTVIKDTKN